MAAVAQITEFSFPHQLFHRRRRHHHHPSQAALSFCPSLKRMRLEFIVITNPFTNTAPFPSCSSSLTSPRLRSQADNVLITSFGEADQASNVERLWQHFFADPSQWCDNRFCKSETEAPDFEHRISKQELRIDDELTPSWVQEDLAALTPSSSPSPATFSTSSTSTISSEALKAKELWEEFFLDPSEWWDNRADNKKNRRTPDFRHKTTKKALWISNRSSPPDIRARLAAMAQSKENGLSGSSVPAMSGRVLRIEQLWQNFFSDPSEWWDNRLVKQSPKFPDFRHKTTREGLWIEDWLNPPWVHSKLATFKLGEKKCWLNSRVHDLFGAGYHVSNICQEGQLKEAIEVMEHMVQQNTQPPINACGDLLRECTRRKALMDGMRLHALIVQSGLDSDIFLGNTLVDMYAKCGDVLHAWRVFDTMPKRNVFSWTAIISAYADDGQDKEAICLFQKMQEAGIAPDKVACVVVLKSCARIAALDQGKRLHQQILKSGFDSDVIVGTVLVDMYSKCGCLEQALEVFNSMPERNVVSWNVMTAAYAQQKLGKEALALHEQMKQEGVKPDNATFVVLLKACADIGALAEGKQLHSDIITSGLKLDVIMGSALMDMYAKCGQLEDAYRVFTSMHERNTVSWNIMIAAYTQKGLAKEALSLYEQMKHGGMEPDEVTYVLLLKACAGTAALAHGKQLHTLIIKSGFESNVIVGSALIHMYAKCGSIEQAKRVFNSMNERDVVLWSAMIAAYAQEGLGAESLSLLDQMQKQGNIKPNEVTYISILSACSHSGLINEGLRVFDAMCKDHAVTPTVDHYACVVDLLGRAGHLADAEVFIDKISIRHNEGLVDT